MATKQETIDLYLTFETSHNTHFNAHLYRLIAKADGENKIKLSMGYSDEVNAYLEWYSVDDVKDFYNKQLSFEEQQMLWRGERVV